MGNTLTKEARVATQPETNGRKRKKREQSHPKLPLRYKILCCNNKVAPLVVTTKSYSLSEESLGNEECSIYSYSEEDIEIQGDGDCRSENSYRSESRRVELPGDRTPLPGIGETTENVLIRRATKCDMNGRPQSVSFDVDFFKNQGSDRPASRMSLKNVQMARRKPKRLNPITLEEIYKKQNVAAQRKQAFMETKATKIRKQPAMTKEMQQKLEVEKQRLLQERLQLKEGEAMERKQRIKEVKEEGMEKMKFRLAKAKQTHEEQQRQRLDSVKRKVEVKMETSKINRKEMEAEQAMKTTTRKIKRNKVKIKKLEVIGEREEAFKNNITRENFGHDNYASLIKGLQFKAKLQKEETVRLEAEVNKLEDESNESYGKIDTYERDPEDAKAWFEEEDWENSDDAFWNVA